MLYSQAAIVVSNFATITTSDSTANNGIYPFKETAQKHKQETEIKTCRERERHTGEDGWSRRQSKSSLCWDRRFWGPHEGPSSQPLLCSYLMHLSPPSFSVSLCLFFPLSLHSINPFWKKTLLWKNCTDEVCFLCVWVFFLSSLANSTESLTTTSSSLCFSLYTIFYWGVRSNN